jgi:hypothetical protein
MEPYIYYGKLPLIEEGPLANYANKLEKTEVRVAIRFRKTTWKADVLAMGFQIDAPFPKIDDYSQIDEVRVSSISPQAPEGPTILVTITGTGIVGLPIVLTPSKAGRQEYTLEYIMSLPIKIRYHTITSDVVMVNPNRAPFTTKDKAGRTYSGVGKMRTRVIVSQSPFGMAGVSGIANFIDNTRGRVFIRNDAKSENDSRYEDGISGRVITQVIDWVEVTNIVYEDGGPPTP